MNPSLAPKAHPRLFLSDQGFAALDKQVQTDAVSKRLAECLRRKADRFYTLPVCKYEKEGKRLLAVSRACLERILTLAMTARLTNEARYTERAIAEMLAAAAFPDWNPSHFLDTAELTFGMAVGYDWLYSQISEQERATISAAIRTKGVGPSLDEKSPDCHWLKGENNWNQVCHAGVCMGALALAEDDPALAARFIERAVADLPFATKAYAPDGAYVEGPTYWDYGTSFQVALIAALESALGQDYGLADSPGFLKSAAYILQVKGPTGRFFNYADSHEASSLQVPLWWFARRLHEPALLAADLKVLDKELTRYESRGTSEDYRLLALALAWYRPAAAVEAKPPAQDLPLHWMGNGPNPVAVHRSAWKDPDATFAAIKGGSPSSSHGHMDAGSFVLEGGGVRWFVDLGMQEYYSIEKLGLNLWSRDQDGDRWKIFRLGSQGHNVLNFNGAQQLVTGHAPIVRFSSDPKTAHTVVDLTSIYSDHAVRVWRGLALLPDGRVLVQDECTMGTLATAVHSQMLTFAHVTIEQGRILMQQDEVQWELRILDDAADVEISIEERSEPVHPYDAPNPGLRMIVLTYPVESHQKRTLRILASPTNIADHPVPPMAPLEDWSRAIVSQD